MEGVEAGDGSDGQNIRTLPAQLLEVVDIPSASSALQSLVEAHGGSVPSYSWEVGWSLAPLNPSSQPTMDAFQRQESIHSNVSAMSETRLAFLGVPIVDCKVLPHINISESSERGDLLLVMGSPFGMLSPTHFLNSIAVGTVANCFPAGSDNSSLLMADVRCLPGMEGGPAFDKNARLMGILMKPLHQRGGGAEIQLVITWDAIATACGSGLENKHQRVRGENDREKFHERQAIPFSNSCKHKRATEDFCEDPGSHYLPQSPSEKAATSVALITIGDGSWASGIVLNNNGLILTNAHLLEPWRFGKSHVLGATNDPKASSPDSQLYRSLFHQHERTRLEEKQSVPSQSSWVSDTSFSNEQAFTFSYSSHRGKRIRVRLDHMEPRIWCNATVVYVSQGPLDIALLQLQPVLDKLCAIIPEFVCPSTGSEVHVIGHGLFGPRYGLGPSVSSGVVSKVVKSPIPVISKEKVLPAMLETTAAIYPGASGGALVNLDGHMIGLITSNAKHGGGTIIPHMNFSIPCAALEPVFKFSKDMQDLSMLHALDEPNELLSSIWALMPSPPSKPKSVMEKFKEGKGSRFAKFLAENQAEIALVGKDQPSKAKPTLHSKL
ncbi:Glyoxysomal processing protease, glyoxysomal [Acorus gramineus]|uniref:Glyoxysomal processing protease, glyoxysomal n=1 Tax=Acorus gramineus TaxID=55184 RepID=A0AAV9BH69_ACOGR|nr:Glyoxysomal processing protease, glyoxysomal [Acorus gramineus]